MGTLPAQILFPQTGKIFATKLEKYELTAPVGSFSLGNPYQTKTDEFSEKFQGGGGVHKFISQIFLYFADIFEKRKRGRVPKNLQYIYPKNHAFWQLVRLP